MDSLTFATAFINAFAEEFGLVPVTQFDRFVLARGSA